MFENLNDAYRFYIFANQKNDFFFSGISSSKLGLCISQTERKRYKSRKKVAPELHRHPAGARLNSGPVLHWLRAGITLSPGRHHVAFGRSFIIWPRRDGGAIQVQLFFDFYIIFAPSAICTNPILMTKFREKKNVFLICNFVFLICKLCFLNCDTRTRGNAAWGTCK